MQQKTFHFSHKESTTITQGQNILEKVSVFLHPYGHSSYLVLCDETTEKLFAKRVMHALHRLKVPASVKVIKSGEKSKSIKTVMSLLKTMHGGGLDKQSALIALGGGVIGDVATVASGFYYRGIDCIQVPTTLLSQVDSAFGGKGAINLGTHKNTVGLIKQPIHVIVDTSLLLNLPSNQVRSGMGEIIKYAISMDVALFATLEKEDVTKTSLDPIVLKCIELKMAIVKKDPLDQTGTRAMLNFGHTVGQAVELLTPLSHGEAVALGMAFAIRLSREEKLLNDSEANRAVSLINRYGLPIRINEIAKENVFEQLKSDKKSMRGVPRFVLLRSIGKAVTNRDVAIENIQKSLEEVFV